MAAHSWNYKEDFPNEPPLVHFYRTPTVFGGCKSPTSNTGTIVHSGRQRWTLETPVDPKGDLAEEPARMVVFRGWWWTCGGIHFCVHGHTNQKHGDLLSSLHVHLVFFVLTFPLGEGGSPPRRRHGETREVTKGPVKRAKQAWFRQSSCHINHQKGAYCHLVLKRRTSSQD